MKKILAIALSLCMIFALCAVSASADDHKPITLNLSMTATMDEHHGACYQPFKEYIEEKCPWITIEIHPSSTLYDDSTFLDAIMRGNVEMGVTAPGYLGEYAEEVAIFAAPYFFDSIEQMNEVCNGELGAEIFQKVEEETGIHILGTLYKGRRTINLREDKEITCRDDLKGVLLRVPNGDSWTKMGQALGATPTAMALSEVYLALNSGTVDGQDNPLQATMLYAFGEVTKSITMTNHVIDINWLCIQSDIWNSFDDETKAVFEEAFKIAYDDCFNAYNGEEADLIAQFRDMGVSVYEREDNSVMAKEVWEYIYANQSDFPSYDLSVYELVHGA